MQRLNRRPLTVHSEQFASPLPHRIYKSKLSGVAPIVEHSQKNRPKHYKLWEKETLHSACDAVAKGMSIRRAEAEYGIPKSTIHDRVIGRVQMGAVSGPQRYLSDNEEAELVRFLLGCAKVGYAHTRKQIITIVQRYLQDKKGLTVNLSNGWWQKFRLRHEELTVRTAERLAYCRAVATDQAILNSYFDLLEQTLTDNDLLSAPSRIFNVDETGFPLEHKPEKVVVAKGCKHPFVVTSGNKAQITVLACVNAAGATIPPMVIFDRKTLKQELYKGEIAETIYGLTDNGWSNSEMFDTWFHNHFLRYIPAVRPVLLMLDGHSSHYNPSTVRMAAEQQVILFCLPPHTTHLTQPLDKSCFSALKSFWNEECHMYTVNNPGKVVTRFQFSTLFSAAWSRAMTRGNIISGFRFCGIYPLNPDSFLARSDGGAPEKQLGETSGVKFIPLYSPVRPRHRERDTHPHVNSEDFQLDESLDDSQMYSPHQSLMSSFEQQGYSHDESMVREYSDREVYTLPKKNALSLILKHPEPPVKRDIPPKKCSAKVLTSSEHIQIMEEKERLKKEKEELKEQRKKIREEKKLQKEVKKGPKKQVRSAASRLIVEDILHTCDNLTSESPEKDYQFTIEEETLFERRYENGFDLATDSRYIDWLQLHYPEEANRLTFKGTSTDNVETDFNTDPPSLPLLQTRRVTGGKYFTACLYKPLIRAHHAYNAFKSLNLFKGCFLVFILLFLA